MSTSVAPGRPGVITLIGIIVWIQAMIAGIVSIASFVFRNDSDFQARAGQTADQLLTTAVLEGILAVVLVLVALGLMRGLAGVRTLVATVMVIRIGFGILTMISQTGGYVASAAVSVAVSFFVLWALYDHKDANAYFGI